MSDGDMSDAEQIKMIEDLTESLDNIKKDERYIAAIEKMERLVQ